MMLTDAQAMEIGKLWEKNGLRRFYLDSGTVLKLIGLEVSRYGTGNISSATLRGEKISNGKAARLSVQAKNGRFWIEAGQLHTKDAEAVEDLLADAIEKRFPV